MLADPDTWSNPQPTPSEWRCRWRLFRNRILANPRFQKWAAKTPLVRRIASQKAVELHHLTAGFVYTQTLTAVIQSNLLAVLQGRIETTKSVAAMCGLTPQAAFTLLTAARALKLTDEVSPGHWMVGELGHSGPANIQTKICGQPQFLNCDSGIFHVSIVLLLISNTNSCIMFSFVLSDPLF